MIYYSYREIFFPELSMNFTNLNIYAIAIQLEEAYHD